MVSVQSVGWAVTIMALGQAQTPTSGPAAAGATGFVPQTVAFGGKNHAYCVYVPPDYTPSRPWPVILFLHGSGERGQDGRRQTEVGIGRALRHTHQQIPAIVIMPQCQPDQTWTGPMAEMALRCVEDTSRKYNLDKDRFYLTGLSLGGAGVWYLGSRLAGQVAALVPICGYGEVGDAAKLAEVPTWCFHGAIDEAVPVKHSRDMVAAIRQAGGDIRYTEYPLGKHNVWDNAYGDAELWKWLFQQRRRSTAVKSEPASATSRPSDGPGQAVKPAGS